MTRVSCHIHMGVARGLWVLLLRNLATKLDHYFLLNLRQHKYRLELGAVKIPVIKG